MLFQANYIPGWTNHWKPLKTERTPDTWYIANVFPHCNLPPFLFFLFPTASCAPFPVFNDCFHNLTLSGCPSKFSADRYFPTWNFCFSLLLFYYRSLSSSFLCPRKFFLSLLRLVCSCKNKDYLCDTMTPKKWSQEIFVGQAWKVMIAERQREKYEASNPCPSLYFISASDLQIILPKEYFHLDIPLAT